jgi:hypothetical protein
LLPTMTALRSTSARLLAIIATAVAAALAAAISATVAIAIAMVIPTTRRRPTITGAIVPPWFGTTVVTPADDYARLNDRPAVVSGIVSARVRWI